MKIANRELINLRSVIRHF